MSYPRPPLYASLLVILGFVSLFSAGAGKPLNLDNMDFPAVASATAATGLPVYYRGEDARNMSGLYHPPLYIYLLAGWIRVFGAGEASVRLFGMVCAVIQGLVVLWMIRTLFGAAVALRGMPFFWAIFLLNPYTLQSAAITDIDSTIYGPLLCLALLAALRISWRDGEWRTDAAGRREYAWVAVALFFCFWAKLTTVWLVIPAVFLLWISRLGVRRAAAATGAVAGAALAGFAGSYWLYGALTGLDISYTFAFTWESFLKRGASLEPGFVPRIFDHWNNLRFMILFMTAWTGLLPWAASGVALWFAALGRRDRRSLHYGVILALALLSTWYYCAKATAYGGAPYKYDFVYWGLILTAPLFVLERYGWWQGTRWFAAALAILYAGAAAWMAARVGDAHLLIGFTGIYRWIAVFPALLFLAGLIRTRITRPLLAGSLCLYGGIQLGVAVCQAKAPYSTTYDYGQIGFMDTVGFIRANTGPEDVIVSMKDIGYRAGRRYYENFGAIYGDEAATNHLIDVMRSGKAAYIVFTEGRGQDQLHMKPRLGAWVRDNCTLVRSFGNYRIYQLRPAARRIPVRQ
jgi:hypothetical protein